MRPSGDESLPTGCRCALARTSDCQMSPAGSCSPGFVPNIIFHQANSVERLKNNVRHKANKRSRYSKAPMSGAVRCLVRTPTGRWRIAEATDGRERSRDTSRVPFVSSRYDKAPNNGALLCLVRTPTGRWRIAEAMDGRERSRDKSRVPRRCQSRAS